MGIGESVGEGVLEAGQYTISLFRSSIDDLGVLMLLEL
jgi:hypothetical protein